MVTLSIASPFCFEKSCFTDLLNEKVQLPNSLCQHRGQYTTHDHLGHVLCLPAPALFAIIVGPDYFPLNTPRFREMASTAGPSKTMNMLGKMNNTRGNISFTVVLAAISSAC